jgi:hypothetical protein
MNDILDTRDSVRPDGERIGMIKATRLSVHRVKNDALEGSDNPVEYALVVATRSESRCARNAIKTILLCRDLLKEGGRNLSRRPQISLKI